MGQRRSFYSQGTRDAADGAAARFVGDATSFLAEALEFFGDSELADSPAPAWDKGARLAALVSRHRTLLILDGLEPLQHPPGPQTGELQDDGLLALFDGLKTSGRGLCVVTTREPVADLAATEDSTTPRRPLDHLTEAAGAAVLKAHGVTGPDSELEQASREVKGHALTLSLAGRFLKLAFDPPDIAQRDCFRFEAADHETSEVREGRGHAFRVFAAYEDWLLKENREVEVAILRLLGLFDRPATPDCLAALCEQPLPGLSEPLAGLGKRQWTAALNRLRGLNLIETSEWHPVEVTGYSEEDAKAVWNAGEYQHDLGPPQPFALVSQPLPLNHSLDAHPLLREYFAWRLSEPTAPGAGQNVDSGAAMPEASAYGSSGNAFQAAQRRLYEHLCASVPYWPEGRDGLLPLYQAVAHGCQAGRFQEVCDDVYCNRILRGTAGSHAAYSTHKLGLLGLDLAAVACFFVEPWSRLASELTPADQAWLLSEAAFRLRALNRLAEARDAFRANLDVRIEQGDDDEALAIAAGNLSELELTLGDVPAAESTAAQSVTFADRSKDAGWRMVNRTTHADALHHAGKLDASRTLFGEAEALQAERQPGYPLLYSMGCYRYCDLLLAPAERAAWREVVVCRPDQAVRRSGISVVTLPERRGAWSGLPLLADLAAIEDRAAQALKIATQNNWLLDIALDHLTLGRVSLLRAVLDSPNQHLPQARTALDTALSTLRQGGQVQFLPLALLPSAWLHALAGEWDMSVQRLNEAFALATRGGNDPAKNYEGGMRLHLIDTLLYRVRLFGIPQNEGKNQKPERKTPEPWPWPDRTPEQDLTEAAHLIEITGYHRRDEELADIRRFLT